MKRWGHALSRELPNQVHLIAIFRKSNGAKYTIYLTESDAIKREDAEGKTWRYITETETGGTIVSVSGSTVTGSGTTWQSSGVAAGDYFILDSDHIPDEEPAAKWVEIDSVDAEDQITLVDSYGSSGSGTYKIRKVYPLTINDRWQCAVVNDNFCFTTESVPVQKWTGSDYASSLDAVNAHDAKYCISYDDRLLIAQGTYRVKWSKLLDPTNWIDNTAGEKDFIETDDFISGFGKVGDKIVVLKEETLVFGYRTGDALTPFAFPTVRPGIGCVAPYGIAEFMGTIAFIGRDDFYRIEGDQPVAIGERIRHTFFDIAKEVEITKAWCGVNYVLYEITWVANTKSYGKLGFTWNWKHDEWQIAQYGQDMTAFGRGNLV